MTSGNGRSCRRKERSLITVVALTAGGNADQLSFHPQYAKDDGATEKELIEATTHLASYAGWPKGMSAMAVAKQAFGRDRPDHPGAPHGRRLTPPRR